jgi:hypothetical protein
MKSIKNIALGFATVVLLWGTPAFGQSDRGTITGLVTDPNGAVVANAKITATDLKTGDVREAASSSEGNFTLPELKADPYKVTAEAQGFKTASAENIQVAVQVTRRLDFRLELGDISNVVTVTGDATPVIQSDTAVRQTNVNERQVRELPLQVGSEAAGRSPLAFIFLDSNVNAATGFSSGQGNGGNGTSSSNFRVSGGQGLGTEILIDGASTRRAQNGTFFSEVAPGPNAFQEFTLSTSTYSAEFGNSSGGVVNFTLKSGGNDFHGEVYDLWRNNAFNANSFLNNLNSIRTPRDHRHNFGGNVGGPIYLPRFGGGGSSLQSFRNRAFFFFNYEGYRIARSETVDLTVPTLRMRQGDFGELLTDPYVLSQLGPVRIYDPTLPPDVRPVIPNNDIQAYQLATGRSIIDPAGLAGVLAFPSPNRPGVYHNYRATSQVPETMNNAVGKVDVQLSEKQHVNFSYSYRKLNSIKGGFPRFPAPVVAQDVWNQFFKSHFARFQYDYTFSPTMLNHLNLGWTRFDVANMNFGLGIRPSSLGMPANATQDAAFPRFGFPGYGSIETSPDPRAYQNVGSTFFSDHLTDNSAQFSDFITWVKGNHTLKIGADIKPQQFNVQQFIDPGGTFNFRNDQTTSDADPGGGWPIASLITGATEFSFVNIHSIDPGWRQFNQSYFVNDDFKLSRRLTLNIGLRYDLPGLRREAHDRFRGFDPTVPNPAAGNRLGALVGAGGQGGLQAQYDTLAKPDRTNWGPRLGFAYALNSKTVVRGGYGLYYAPILYGFGGGNSITEGLLGYNTTADPFSTPPRRPINFGRQSAFFLRSLPPAPSPDPNGQFIGASNVDYFNKDFKTGRTAQWSLDVQRELPAKFAVSVGYIGHKGNRLKSDFNRINALPLNALRLGYPLLNKNLNAVNADDRAYASSVGVTLPASSAAVFPTFDGSVAQALRPFPQYGDVRNILEHEGQSWYNAAQIKVDRRFAQGIQFGVAYTFSKLITTASEDLFGGSPLGGILQNPYDRKQLKSVSPNNPYHVIVFNYLIELPFGKGKRFLNQSGLVDKFLGGWQLGAIHRYQSGLPLVVLNSDPGRAGFLGLVGFGGNLRPNLTGQPIFTTDRQNGAFFQLVNPGAFINPPNFQAPPTNDVTSPAYAAYYANPTIFFGTAPPVLDKSRYLPFRSENLSLLKKTRFAENFTLELGAEAFNLFNRHRYFGPANDLRFGDFGRANVINDDTYGPRVIQMRVRMIF